MALTASDVPAMYSLLSNSMSADHRLRGPAEEALAQSESRPGFCSCLLEVITAKDLAPQTDVRMMATVYFKNSVNRYWRHRRDSSGISNEEKMHLRQKLLTYLREENDQIALMLAVLISKIARIDYPKEWPDIFLVLSQQLQSADVLASHRIFLILFRTLKELSTKRLTSDQRNFAEISSHFFDYSWRLWQSDVQTILHGFSSLSQNCNLNAEDQPHELYLTCERWLLCSKIVRQLVISGFQSDSKCFQEVRPVKEVSPVFLSAIQSLLPYYSSFQKQYPKFWDIVKRACTKLMKILVAFQGRHPYSFGDKFVLSSVMDICLNKITDPEPYLLSFEQFLIQCMVMIKNILECKEYKPSVTGRVMDENGVTLELMKKNISSAVGGVLTSLLPTERIVHLCNVLISRYFVLTANDLEEWYRNPESFHHEQDMVQWTEKLRPCAEALYIVLFETNSQVGAIYTSQLLGPVVVSLLQESMNNCPTSVTEITPALLLKDAVYGATAYVYYELSNYLSFKDWFNGALSLELSNEHPNLRIIHRKVAVILGQWVSEIKDDTKRPVYCSLIRLLQGKDLAVRLAACRSLCLHIEDANFSEREFVDLLPVCWDSCFKLFEEVQEFDSKVQVLNLISILIGHVSEVIPFANKLVQFFQKVWEESSGESLLQIQLLVALKNFVVALGYQSPICYNILLPILENGIDINSPDELNLLEDSMLLWEATLSHAPSMVPQLLQYFSRLVDIMERNFDHLQVAVNIIEDYIILGGNDFLSMHATNIAKILDLVIGNVNNKGLLSVLPVVDILVQCFPMEVPPLISSTLQKLIVICLSGGDDHDPSKTSVKASSAAILARLLVMNTNSLAQLASDPSTSLLLQTASIPVQENILLCLVDIWVDKVDNVSSIQKKTIGLALSIILTLRLPQVLDKLDQILSVCTSVILGRNDDLTEEESSGDMGSSASPDEGTIPSKEFRKRQIKFSDSINQLSLEECVKENLQTCAAIHGESFNAAMSSMHPSAFAQLKQALKMP
ncbi:importin-11 isoform X1 [Cajanus cajan]|uniref:importin-11 isoform X1 n=1 Tax=Cajanus cajan TaxID=3821 RepID=UPI0010FB1E01|nr:importin-11 isoform X1 [Cajanus cajan]XP_029130608.1 importin-11 isoform X1 [Cajanus cajan]